MQSVKYSVIVFICVSLFLSNVAFAREKDNELSELLKYQTNLMKYQAEAKDPGMAALLGIFGFGLGHYYVSRKDNFYTGGEIASLTLAIGGTVRNDKNSKLIGAAILAILRIIEPFSAYNSAVQYNKKLLDKYDIDLSLSTLDKGFRLTYRF